MESNSNIFTSSGRSAHLWSPRERLEVNRGVGDNFIRIEIVTQGLAGKTLNFVGNLWGKESHYDSKIKSCRLINFSPSDEQCLELKQILKDDASLPLEALQQRMVALIHDFSQKVLNASEPTSETCEQGIGSEDNPADSKRKGPMAFSSMEEIFEDDVPDSEMPLIEKLNSLKEAFHKIVKGQSSPKDEMTEDGQKVTNIGNLALYHLDWWANALVPGYNYAKEAARLIKGAAQQVTKELWTDSSTVEEDDQQDLQMLKRYDEPLRQMEESIKDLAPLFSKGTEGYYEFIELTHKVLSTRTTLETLKHYFHACEELDTALDGCADQLETIRKGKIDLSLDNYLNVEEKIKLIKEIGEKAKSLNPFWQKRIEKKCTYLVKQTKTYLEVFTDELQTEAVAEIKEVKAQFYFLTSLIEEDRRFKIEHLISLYSIYCRATIIHKKSLAFINKIEVQSQELLDLSFTKEELEKNIKISFLQQLRSLKKSAKPEELILDKLNAYEATLAEKSNSINQEEMNKQLARCYATLEFLQSQASVFSKLPKLSHACVLLGKEASRRKQEKELSYSLNDLYEDVYQNEMPLSSAKQKVVNENKLELENLPSGSTKWRAFFIWLQFWDLMSPLAGLLMKPVGRIDHNFHVAMMARTAKTDPEQYQYHLERARGYFGMHPEYEEFITKYDEYLRGDVSYSLEKIPMPTQLGGAETTSTIFSLFESTTVKPGGFDDTQVSWWDAFLGRDPQQAAMKDASDWEKWLHYTIFPQVRDRHFDAVVQLFNQSPTPELSLNSTPEEQLTYHFYHMYQSLKTPSGEEIYNTHLTQAKTLYHYQPFLKEFHNYLQDRRLAFSAPIPEIPITSLPLGKEVLNQMELDAKDFTAAHPEDKYDLLTRYQKDLQELTSYTPAEYADLSGIKAWLKKIDALRASYLTEKSYVRSTLLQEEWKDLISEEKLKIYLKTASEITLDQFAQIFGMKGNANLLDILDYLLRNNQIRIESIKKGSFCTNEQPTAFCDDYNSNSFFAAALTDATALETLAKQTEEAKSLSLAFKEESAEDFGNLVKDRFSSMHPGEALFFVVDGTVYELIKQSDHRLTLRYYTKNHKEHFQVFVGTEQTISPYHEIADIPIFVFKNAEFTEILKNTWKPHVTGIQHFTGKLMDFFSKEKFEVRPLEFIKHQDQIQRTPYQTLAAIRQLLHESARFVFESQLKALSDFQQQHSHSYSQKETFQIVEQALTQFLVNVQTWQSNQIISEGELHFSVQTAQLIKESLKSAKIKQHEEFAKSLSFNNLKAQKLEIPNAVEFNFTEINATAPSITKRDSDFTESLIGKCYQLYETEPEEDLYSKVIDRMGDINPPGLIYQLRSLRSHYYSGRQITKTLSFYSRNIHLLNNSDHQQLLSFLLCSINSGIGYELDKHPLDNAQFATMMTEFFKRAVGYYIYAQDVNTAAFLLRVYQEVFYRINRIGPIDSEDYNRDAISESTFYANELKRLLALEGWSQGFVSSMIKWHNTSVKNLRDKKYELQAEKSKLEEVRPHHTLERQKEDYDQSIQVKEIQIASINWKLTLIKSTLAPDLDYFHKRRVDLNNYLDSLEISRKFWNESINHYLGKEELKINLDNAKKALTEVENLLKEADKELSEILKNILISFDPKYERSQLNAKFRIYKEGLQTWRTHKFPKGFNLPFQDGIKGLKNLLLQPDLKLETISFIYAQLALTYVGYDLETTDDAEELLHAVMTTNLQEASKEMLSDFDKCKLDMLLRRNRNREVFSKILKEDANGFLNRVYQGFHSGAAEIQWIGEWEQGIWKWNEGEWGYEKLVRSFSSLDGHIKIDLLEGKLYENEGAAGYLPKSISDHPLYKKIFGVTPLALATKWQENTPENSTPRNVYLMMGRDNHAYRLIAEGQNLFIQREVNQKWYQLADDKNVLDKLKLPFLFFGTFNYWYGKDAIFFSDKESSFVKFKLEVAETEGSKNLIEEIDASGNPTGIVLGDPTTCALTALLGKVADQRKMVIFKDASTNLVKQYILPDLGIHFELQKEGAICPELDHAVLSSQQTIETLGNLKNYLVLEKKSASGTSKRVLFATPHLAHPFEIYDLDIKTNRLIPRTEAGSFFLAKQLHDDQTYIQSFNRLQLYQNQHRPLTADSQHALASFLESADDHPHALAVQLKAAAMLISQRLDRFQEQVEIDSDHVLDLYLKYLEAENVDIRIKLSADEENLIIRQCAHLLDEASIPQQWRVLERKKALGHALTVDQHFVLHTITTLSPKTSETVNLADIIVKTYYPTKNSEKAILSGYFIDLYNLVRQKDFYENQPSLRQNLSLFIGIDLNKNLSQQQLFDILAEKLEEYLTNGPTEKALESILLKAVMENPAAFPANLKEMDNFRETKGKQNWVRRTLISPLRKQILVNPSLQKFVFGIPTHLPLSMVETSIDQTPSPQITLPSVPPALPATTLEEASIRKIMPNEIEIQEDQAVRKNLLNFCNQSVKDNIAKKGLESLKGQLQKYYKTSNTLKPAFEIIDKDKFNAAVRQLSDRSQKIGVDLEAQKDAIVTLANKLAEKTADQDLNAARLMTNQMTSVTLEECLFLYLGRDIQKTRQRNPALTVDDVTQLYTMVRDYLLMATDKQHLEAIIDFSKSEETLDKMAYEIERVRAYNVDEHPEYLFLEYATAFWLKEETQIESIRVLLDDYYNGKIPTSKLLELIMGAGKSSMIIPIVSYVLAQNGRLTITVMPAHLIKDMAPGYKEKMGKAFDLMLQIIEDLNRNSPWNADTLSRLAEVFETVLKEKRVILISSESLYTLYLKLPEILNEAAANKSPDLVAEEIQSLIRIFNLIKEKGTVIIDEIDLILDVLRSFHFTVGQPLKLNEINPLIGQTIIDFFRFLNAHPELHMGLKINLSSEPSNLPFSKKLYSQNVKGALINGILNGLFQTKENFSTFISQLTEEQKEYVRNFLHGDMHTKVLAFTDTLSSDIQDILALLYESINALLPLTAPKRLQEHFGIEVLDEKGTLGILAAPRHLGKTTPSGTHHGTELETLFYSILTYMELGFSVPMVQQWYKLLLEEHMEEVKLGVPMDKTSASKQLNAVGGGKYQMRPLTQSDYEELTDLINSKRENIFRLIEKLVIPEIEVYLSQLNADSQLFGILYDQIIGMTGTKWNAEAMTAAIEKIIDSPTTPKTLHLIFKNKSQKIDIIPTPSETTSFDVQSQVRSIYQSSLSPTSIIDAGYIFRGQDPIEVCKAMIMIAEEKGWGEKICGTYSQEGEMVIVSKNKEEWVISKASDSKPSKEKALFFWPLAYFTGSDVNFLSPTMTAAVSISRHTLLRDLLQAVWRLRGLDMSQKVRFVITEEDRKVILETLEQNGKKIEEIGLEELLLYVLIQQAERQGSDNYRSFKQKLYAILLKKIFSIMLQSTSVQIVKLFEACRSLFETPMVARPYETYAKSLVNKTKKEAVDEDIDAFLKSDVVANFLNMVEDYSIEDLKKEVFNLKNKEFSNLPDTIEQNNNYGRERAVQKQNQMKVETKTQKTTNINVDVEVENENSMEIQIDPKKKFENFLREYWDYWPEHGLLSKNYFSSNSDLALSLERVFNSGLKEYQNLFDKRILCSANLCHLDPETKEANNKHWFFKLTSKILFPKIPVPYQLYTARQSSFTKVLLIEDKETSEIKMLLLGPKDELQFFDLMNLYNKQLITDEEEKYYPNENRVVIYDLYTGLYQQAHRSDRMDASRLEENPNFLLLKVQAKFLSGEVNYSIEEQKYLEKWFENVDKQKLKQLFVDHILPWSMNTREFTPSQYNKSYLAKQFGKIRIENISSTHIR